MKDARLAGSRGTWVVREREGSGQQMAVVQLPGAPFDVSGESTTAPLVVLFERDDAIAVPLLSQIRLAGYDVRASRTPVELFDLLGKHLVSLVLVDLGNATAGRREFWVALDAQRRGRSLQVMTFRYNQPGGFLDADFEPAGRAVADVEVRGPQEFALIVDGVRQRIPLAGAVDVSAPGLGALGALGAAPPAFGAAPAFGASAGPAYGAQQAYPVPLGQPQMGYQPGFAIPGAQQPSFALPGMSPNPMTPVPDPYGYAAQGYPTPQPGAPAFGAPQPAFAPSPFGQPEAGSPFAQPMGTNPFAAEEANSAFARPLEANPFAIEQTGAIPTMRQPAFDPFASAQPAGSPFGAPATPAPQPLTDPGFEARAARLSATYAAQFGIPDAQPVQSSPAAFPGAIPYESSPRHTWGAATPAHHPDPWSQPHPWGAPSRPAHAEPSAAPIADAWTPPDSGLDGQTGVVPGLANVPIGGHSPAQAETFGWGTSHPSEPQPTAHVSAPRMPSRPSPFDASPPQTASMPTPPSHRALVPTPPAETALGNVLLEGALLSPQKLEALKGVQQMLASVDMNFSLGDLALLFKFLSPDQLLAALLVSRGYVSPQQIAGLGRVKQELAASGMDYDLETLLSMFHILSPDQLRQIRADLH